MADIDLKREHGLGLSPRPKAGGKEGGGRGRKLHQRRRRAGRPGKRFPARLLA